MSCSNQFNCLARVPWDLQVCSHISGSCTCSRLFTPDGDCATTGLPQASLGFLVTSLALTTMLTLISFVTLANVIKQKGALKLNTIAGRTYMLSLMAILSSLITSAFTVGVAFDRVLLPVMLAFDNLSIICVNLSIVSMSTALFRFVTVRVMKKVPFHRQKTPYGLVTLMILFLALFYSLDFRVYSIITLVVVLVIGCFGGIYPVVVFVRNVTGKSDAGAEYTRIVVLAALSEYFLRNGAASAFLGFDSKDDYSRGGPLTPKASRISWGSTTTNLTTKRIQSGSGVLLTRAHGSSVISVKKPEGDSDFGMFFVRLIHLGANILFFSTCYVGCWCGFLVVLQTEADSPVRPTFTLASVLWSIRQCCFLGVNYSVLSFTEHLYRKRARRIADYRRTVDLEQRRERENIAPWIGQPDEYATKSHDIKMLKATSTKRNDQKVTGQDVDEAESDNHIQADNS